MSDLMVLDLGGAILPYDQTQAAELVKGMTAGLGGDFKRSARLSMGNSGDWELITEDGEIIDQGREVNIVIVDQREYVSRVHFEKPFEEMKAEGEMLPPDCQSFDGISPDASVDTPFAEKCKDCPYSEKGSTLPCSYYRRLVGVMVYEDGTFSPPFVFEPKAKSLWDETVLKQRYTSYSKYVTMLASNKRNGVAAPVPVQAVVTRCLSLPKAPVATIKFGVASTESGGYWTLSKKQFAEILRLKASDEVKDMLKPFNAATNNPSSAGKIPVMNIDVEATTTEVTTTEVAEEEKPVQKPMPKPKPKPTPKAKKTVVLGINHPDVVNSEDFNYADIKAWADEADEADVKEWLQENFPQALEPVETEEVVAEEKPTPPRAKKAPAKKAEAVKQAEEVVDTTGQEVSPELQQKAAALADGLDDFDD